MSQLELLVVTSIPSPYRLHQLAAIERSLASRGGSIRVLFLAGTERGRHWDPNPELAPFPHRVARGFTLSGYDHPLHLSPGPWLEGMRTKPRWIVLGATWYQPAIVATSIAHSSTSSILFWNESVTQSTGRSREVTNRLRRFVLARSDGFVVPGGPAMSYVRRCSPAPALRLRNVVDEGRYHDRVDELRHQQQSLRQRWGFAEESVVFVWPARLIPTKGFAEFLPLVRDAPGDYIIAIAGEGPQRAYIERLVTDRGDERVRLVGHQDEERMLELYALADVLLLPSQAEPFGFVAVEALWAGLPMIISSRAGACPDVLEPGRNGWAVDTRRPDELGAAFRAAVGAGRDGLRSMGGYSRTIAQERFNSQDAADSFVDQLVTVFPP